MIDRLQDAFELIFGTNDKEFSNSFAKQVSEESKKLEEEENE